jgi:hypothetical protein
MSLQAADGPDAALPMAPAIMGIAFSTPNAVAPTSTLAESLL